MSEPQTLPRTLRERAESFFAAPLADVEVVADPEVAALGALACACGRRVRLAPRVAEVDRAARLAVLAHELAHVVQQAEGRTPVTARIGGLPANDDPVLEAEADELARRFVAGGPPRRRPAAPAGPPAAVVQRTVTVGGAYLASAGALGEKERQVLGLIHHGPAWLDWAVGAAGVPYEFATSEALVEGIQTGLHGSPLTVLPRLKLLVSPRKLLALDATSLSQICAWEQGGETPSLVTRVLGVLHRNYLWTQEDLAAGKLFLEEQGVATQPFFQVLSLLDELTLLELLSEPQTPFGRGVGFAPEAAEFAAERAQSPREFVDYFQLYLATIEKLGTKNVAKERRLHRARGILEEILPLAEGALRCPALARPPALAALPLVLRDWIAAGNVVGFARLSAAASQMYQESELRQQSGEEAEKLLARYMTATQRFLLAAEPTLEVLFQDGVTRAYRLQTATGDASLLLDAAGDLTLTRCHLQKIEKERP